MESLTFNEWENGPHHSLRIAAAQFCSLQIKFTIVPWEEKLTACTRSHHKPHNRHCSQSYVLHICCRVYAAETETSKTSNHTETVLAARQAEAPETDISSQISQQKSETSYPAFRQDSTEQAKEHSSDFQVENLAKSEACSAKEGSCHARSDPQQTLEQSNCNRPDQAMKSQIMLGVSPVQDKQSLPVQGQCSLSDDASILDSGVKSGQDACDDENRDGQLAACYQHNQQAGCLEPHSALPSTDDLWVSTICLQRHNQCNLTSLYGRLTELKHTIEMSGRSLPYSQQVNNSLRVLDTHIVQEELQNTVEDLVSSEARERLEMQLGKLEALGPTRGLPLTDDSLLSLLLHPNLYPFPEVCSMNAPSPFFPTYSSQTTCASLDNIWID